MIEAVGNWILGVTCAALLGALACELSGKGTLGQAGRLLSGLVLLWAVLSPLPGVDIARLTQPMLETGTQLEQERERWNEQSATAMRTVIEQESQAYILDKAQQLGLDCQVRVTCRMEGGVWLPWSVRVSGIAPSAALSRAVEEELGIAAERIRYEGGE